MKSRIAWKHKLPGTFSAAFLFAAGRRLVTYVAKDKGRAVLAYEFDGGPAWTYDYSPAEHNRFFPFGSSIYLDGKRVLAIDLTSGRVAAERQFQDEMTIQGPSELGPVFLRGALMDATAVVGLNPSTLVPEWEWPDVNCLVRRTWLCRRAAEQHSYLFIRVPDLLEVELATDMLPLDASGRDAIFSPPLGLWCAFGARLAAAVSLPSGTAAWRREEDTEGHHRVLWSTEDRAYAGVTELSEYDLSNGRLNWRRPFPGPIGQLASGTSTAGFITTQKRTLHRVDLHSGEPTGQFEAPAEIVGIAAIDDSRVAIATHTVLMCIAFE